MPTYFDTCQVKLCWLEEWHLTLSDSWQYYSMNTWMYIYTLLLALAYSCLSINYIRGYFIIITVVTLNGPQRRPLQSSPLSTANVPSWITYKPYSSAHCHCKHTQLLLHTYFERFSHILVHVIASVFPIHTPWKKSCKQTGHSYHDSVVGVGILICNLLWIENAVM